MRSNLKFVGLAGVMSAIVGMGPMTACTTDSAPADAGVGGTGNGDGGTVGGSGGAGGAGGATKASASVCAAPTPIPAAKPSITDFDSWDGSNISKWYFPWAGDTSIGVQAGPFGYGDIKGTDSTGAVRTDLPKTFDMVAGYNGSKYALRIADTMAMNYGGGEGLWISTCIDATQFAGISFWVRGNLPTGKSTLTISMGDTTPTTPSASGTYGTCPGVSTGATPTCKNPTYAFTVTDTWTQIQIPWASFTPGLANGSPVMPDGRNITQLQLGADLNWVAPPADAGNPAYVPVPAPYELVSDSWTFY